MSYLILLCTLKYIFIFYHVNIIQMEKFEVEAEAGLKNYSIFLNPAEDIKIVFVFLVIATFSDLLLYGLL